MSESTLQEILDARERRAATQRRLQTQFGKTLISFTMNIPGPIKTDLLIEKGFLLGQELLLAQLQGEGVPILHQQQGKSAAGPEGFYVVDGQPEQIKKLTLELEENTEAGRLFDFDVLDKTGKKWDREALGRPERSCLICGKSARICGRSRTHSVSQLQAQTHRLLKNAIDGRDARRISALAVRGLLYEVCTTPKPGLVDRHNSGSHRDMDIFTFMASAPVLEHYFYECVRIGQETGDLRPEETFARLRLPGKIAQQEMLRATGGVNTHKGAIFTLGILCGALGRMEKSRNDPARILQTCAAMTKGLTQHDYGKVGPKNAKTAGERLYVQRGITGVRGQAEAGFPLVLTVGLPALEKGLLLGHDLNRAGCGTLLALMTQCADTNLIKRGGWETSIRARKEIEALLHIDPYPEEAALERLDESFIQRNLSPGGSADLLAATYFLYFLKQEF